MNLARSQGALLLSGGTVPAVARREREKVVNDDAKRWTAGRLPSAEYFAKVYAEERASARREVTRALKLGRRQRRAGDGQAQA